MLTMPVYQFVTMTCIVISSSSDILSVLRGRAELPVVGVPFRYFLLVHPKTHPLPPLSSVHTSSDKNKKALARPARGS